VLLKRECHVRGIHSLYAKAGDSNDLSRTAMHGIFFWFLMLRLEREYGHVAVGLGPSFNNIVVM
jgi:hypothetical protein